MNRRKLAIVFTIVGISTILVSSAVSLTSSREDPYANYRFRVEIDGIVKAGFNEVQGLNITVEVVEYREANEPTTTIHLLPGLTHYGPLILRFGATDDSQEMWDWIEQVLEGKMDLARRNMSIIIVDSEGNDAIRYNLSEAWPSGWSLDKLNSVGRSIAIEELIIQYEGLTRQSYAG